MTKRKCITMRKVRYILVLILLTIFTSVLFGCETVKTEIEKLDNTSQSEQSVNTNNSSNYNRKDWNHWLEINNQGWNVREEVIKKQSLDIVIENKKGQITQDESKYSKIRSVKLLDPYTNELIYDIKKIDIDHIVPLKWAHEHGAASWDSAKKEQFANDYENLLAVSSVENRTKGAKGLDEYLPPNKKYIDEYKQKFDYIVKKYGLEY